MPDINSVVAHELPSTRQLVRSTIIAAVTASVLLVTVVLPAEYGLDPTGVGGLLGLTEMGDIKVSLTKEAAAAEADTAPLPSVAASVPAAAVVSVAAPKAAAAVAVAVATNSHETRIALQPGEGKEVKLVMREGARATYSWSTDQGVVNYDMHGDSVSPKRDYHGYTKGRGVPGDKGELVAAFGGSHGWFWRNRTGKAVTVTLRTEGEYNELKRLN